MVSEGGAKRRIMRLLHCCGPDSILRLFFCCCDSSDEQTSSSFQEGRFQNFSIRPEGLSLESLRLLCGTLNNDLTEWTRASITILFRRTHVCDQSLCLNHGTTRICDTSSLEPGYMQHFHLQNASKTSSIHRICPSLEGSAVPTSSIAFALIT